MSTVHFVFPTMSLSSIRVSLYGVGAPATPTLLYAVAKSVNFGNYDNGRCWDTSIHSESKMLENVKPGDLVCATATVSGYKTCLSMLKQAKNLGAIVAIGGPWVTARYREIYAHHGWIDYIVHGEGEAVLRKILFGTARKGLLRGDACKLISLTAPDFSGWSLSDLVLFNQNYHTMIESGEYGRAPAHIPAFLFYQSTRGCIQRPRCAFCGVRLGERLNWRTADQYHADIEAIRVQFAPINERIHIFDTSDSFASVLHRFDGAYEKHEGVTLTVFSRVDEVNEATADAMRALGVNKVSLGIECGSDSALLQMGKSTTASQNEYAVRLLSERGVSVYMNFMYGLPGETRDSLQRTVDHCLRLGSYGNVYRAKGRITTPLPGSRWFRELAKARPDIDGGADWIAPRDLGLAWLKERTHVSLDDIQEANMVFVSSAKKLGISYSAETAVWFG